MNTHLVEVGHININISLIQFINQNSQAKTVLIVKINIYPDNDSEFRIFTP